MSTEIRIFFSGDEYYDSCIAAINSAEKEILFESYIFEIDTVGLRFLDAMEAAVKKGVTLRLLVDGIGSMNSISKLEELCQKKNIPFRIYHPMLKSIRNLNRRNHRKVLTIDEKFIFLGSYNISNLHSEKISGSNSWRDTGLSFKFEKNSSTEVQTEVQMVKNSFSTVWSHKPLFFKRLSSPNLRLNSNPFLRWEMLREINQKIKKAQSRILITNPYLIPRPSVLRNLKKAARQGKLVMLLLPAVSDVWFVREASRSLYERLLKSGIQIFEYQSKVLHAKTMIIDNWATIGSSNLYHRSLIHDLEISAVLNTPETIELLKDQWDRDLMLAKKIKLANVVNGNIFRKILGRICYWFRYWL
jgi:cardiolipin synthase